MLQFRIDGTLIVAADNKSYDQQENLFIFKLGDTTDASSTTATWPEKQFFDSHWYLLDSIKAVFSLEEGLLSKTIPTVVDLLKSLHQQDLSGLPLFQDQQLVSAVLEFPQR